MTIAKPQPYSGLSSTEQDILDALCAGNLWGSPEGSAPISVSAGFLRGILTSRVIGDDAKAILLDGRGLRLRNAVIVGELDLTALEYRSPMEFEHCTFDHAVTLTNARVGPVSFTGSRMVALVAATAEIQGDLTLKSVQCGSINLHAARIRGSLLMGGAKIGGVEKTGSEDVADIAGKSKSDEAVLDCYAIEVNGSVLLEEGFHARGEVNFESAVIGQSFDCAGGTFENQGGDAIDCNGIEIDGNAYLCETDHGLPFAAHGAVIFIGASVAGQFACEGGQFRNEQGVAFECDSISVGADVFVRKGFRAVGDVNFRGSVVKGDFNCGEASFEQGADADGEKHYAINLDGARVEGSLLFVEVSAFRGRLSLQDAYAKRIADDGSIWNENWKHPGEPAMARDGVTTFLDRFWYDSFSVDYDNDATPEIGWKTRLAWLRSQPASWCAEDFRAQPFTQCAKVLRSMGQANNARLILYNREWLRLRHSNIGWGEWSLRTVVGTIAGHGYKTYRAVLALAVIWLVGWLVFANAYSCDMIRPTAENLVLADLNRIVPPLAAGKNAALVKDFKPGNYEPFKAWLYSADVLLPIIDFAQKNYWLPRDGGERNPGLERILVTTSDADWAHALRGFFAWLPKMYYWFEIVAGWILTTIAVAGFTGLLGHGGAED